MVTANKIVCVKINLWNSLLHMSLGIHVCMIPNYEVDQTKLCVYTIYDMKKDTKSTRDKK